MREGFYWLKWIDNKDGPWSVGHQYTDYGGPWWKIIGDEQGWSPESIEAMCVIGPYIGPVSGPLIEREKDRAAAKAKAEALGYFWLPCPVCKEDFAGFECGSSSVPTPEGPADGRIVCSKPECVEEGNRLWSLLNGRSSK